MSNFLYIIYNNIMQCGVSATVIINYSMLTINYNSCYKLRYQKIYYIKLLLGFLLLHYMCEILLLTLRKF